MKVFRIVASVVVLVMLIAPAASIPAVARPAVAPEAVAPPSPQFSAAAAFDVSPALRDLAQAASSRRAAPAQPNEPLEVRPERGTPAQDRGFSGDAARQDAAASQVAPAIPGTLANFEGLSNQDNANVFGFRVNPPDPNGAVGPNHYVEMINLVFGVYDKQGNLLLGPVDTGTLWSNFAVSDCTDPSGDPIVLYDQFADRWLLSQFTTRGPEYWNCVAVSQTGDPTGAYYRYAFSTGLNFPDYPKYGMWRDSYIITTREFGPTVEYGIGVYGLERNKMIDGDPTARAVRFYLDGNAPGMLPLVGDGLLPPTIDGKQQPKNDAPAPIIGTQDDGGGYGATFDALNIWDFDVKWRSTPVASIKLAA